MTQSITMSSASATKTVPTPAEGDKPFRLLRHFSVASFLCIAIAIALLMQWDERTRTRELYALGNHNNETLTQALLHALWPDLHELMRMAPSRSDEELRAHPHITKLNASAQALVRGGTTAKIKFYNLEGRTLYSSELSQIGQSQAENSSFKAAVMGATSTALNHRDTFEVFGKTVTQRDLLSTYLPVRSNGNAVVAVLEIYDDVTPFVTRLRGTGWRFLIGATVILLMLYGVLFLVVRRADRILRQQRTQRIEDKHTLAKTQSDLAQLHEDSLSSETRIRLLNDALPIMLAYIDRDERYCYVNNRFCIWTKRKPDDIIGRTSLEVHGERVHALFREDTAKVLSGERVSSIRSHVARSGAIYDTAYTFIPQYESDGSVAGFHALLQDITDQKNTERALVAAKGVAEAATRAKSQFLATMSHEIRTPMNGVLGMAEMLQTCNLDPQAREYARIIRSSGESLLHIIDDILDFSKIEAGKLELEIIDFGLPGSIHETLSILSARASGKGIQLNYHIASTAPETIAGDPTRLRQILLNLLGNAIKFTEKGSVTLDVRREDESTGTTASAAASDCVLRFEVTDTGVGMAPAALDNMFKPFSQGDESTTRRYGGTGLGLAISKQLVEIMGGRVGVRSELGKGSTFWFTIPVRIASHPASLSKPQKVAVAATRTGPACRVLLAEDNIVNQAVAKAMLDTLGCVTTFCANGAQAVETATATHDSYDIILMDCNMPELDGWEATRQIRTWETGHHPQRRIPIVALTANALQGDRELCLAAGMDDFLSKPFKREELRAALARWTGMARP